MAAGCQKKPAAAPAGAGMQGLPVQTVAVTLSSVPQSSEYMATIKSRRSATLQPQVDGRLTEIRVRSGDHVQAGQLLIAIDPLHQQASVDSARATERQKKALYDYNTVEIERQRKLFEAGITSREVFEQAQQAYDNTKADYEASVAQRKTQEEQLAYYSIRAPFAGVVGDIPVHLGDYVSSSTMLTTVDENKDLEAYIYIPTERAGQVRQGLDVDLAGHQRQSAGEDEDRFPFSAGGQRPAGNPGESPGARHAGDTAQRTDGEGARHLGHHAHGGHSSLSRHPPGRAELCLCRQRSRTATGWLIRLRSPWAIQSATLIPSPRDSTWATR